jgi:hypothetical protein
MCLIIWFFFFFCQTIFIIFVFSKSHINTWVSFVESVVPSLREPLENFLESQRKQFHRPIGENLGPASVLVFLTFPRFYNCLETLGCCSLGSLHCCVKIFQHL